MRIGKRGMLLEQLIGPPGAHLRIVFPHKSNPASSTLRSGAIRLHFLGALELNSAHRHRLFTSTKADPISSGISGFCGKAFFQSPINISRASLSLPSTRQASASSNNLARSKVPGGVLRNCEESAASGVLIVIFDLNFRQGGRLPRQNQDPGRWPYSVRSMVFSI